MTPRVTMMHAMTDTKPEVTLAAYELPQIPQRQHDRVAIVGFADGHRDAAPWDDDDIEFWGLNRLHAVLGNKPWTRWFEIHSLEQFYGNSAPDGFDQEHVTFLKQFHGPVYIRPSDLDLAREWGIENAEPYPVERMLQTYHPYFNNSISWLLALAMEMGPKREIAPLVGFSQIQMFGVDMAQDSIIQAEYRQQRPSCEWLMGMAQGKGIEIVLPPGSDLLKASHLYGFSDDLYQQKLLARMQEISGRKEAIRAQMTEAQGQVTFMQARISELDGVLQELQYQLTNLVTPSPVSAIPEGTQ